LLEFEEDTAGGLMNTEYIALDEDATVAEGFTALRGNEELLESLNTLFLVDRAGRLTGAVPVARVFAAPPEAPLRTLRSETLIRVPLDERQDRVIDSFDKYNLLTLPVVDGEGRLAGAITADDIIAVLRQK
jgi:Mg/Co/Ni transporter MgtE